MSNLDSVVSAAIEDSAVVPGLSFAEQPEGRVLRARAELVNLLRLRVQYLLSQHRTTHIEVSFERWWQVDA